MRTEFEALIQSLGEHVVDYLGTSVSTVRIWADELTETARIQICLREATWEAQARAIDKMLELRGMFLDDLSFDYYFVDADACTPLSSSRSPELIFA